MNLSRLQNSEVGSKGDFIAKIEKIFTDKKSEVGFLRRSAYLALASSLSSLLDAHHSRFCVAISALGSRMTGVVR